MTSSALLSSGITEVEIESLRQQLQMLKQQAAAALDQARHAIEREEAAVLQAKRSAALEAAATLRASQAENREEYVLELMTSAGQDVAGKSSFFFAELVFVLSFCYDDLCATQVREWTPKPKKKE